MQRADQLERIRIILKRRVLEFVRYWDMTWSNRELHEFMVRLQDVFHAQTEVGIDDVDLRVLVRLYNRELIGRRNRPMWQEDNK